MEKEKICAIISGGEYSPLAGIEKADFVIACDKGCEYAEKNGIIPDRIIGDFDSLGRIPSERDGVTVLPCEKDDTDTMSAVRIALKGGFDKIVIYCAFGGRLDHLLGNIQVGMYIVSKGVKAEIVSEENTVIYLSHSSEAVLRRDGFSLSLLSLSDSCSDVTVTGAKYPLERAALTNLYPIGISNEWISDSVTVSVGDGVLAVISSKL